jgi:hypothetical protein
MMHPKTCFPSRRREDTQTLITKISGQSLREKCRVRLFQVFGENGFRIERALSKVGQGDSITGLNWTLIWILQQARTVRNWTDTKEDKNEILGTQRGAESADSETRIVVWGLQTFSHSPTDLAEVCTA